MAETTKFEEYKGYHLYTSPSGNVRIKNTDGDFVQFMSKGQLSELMCDSINKAKEWIDLLTMGKSEELSIGFDAPPQPTPVKYTRFRDIPKLIHGGDYHIHVSWMHIERWLSEEYVGADLNPDFQRGHVWSRDKQIRYVEYILRGGKSSKDIYFNNSGWMLAKEDDTVLVDGKQRLEAVRAFLRNEFPVFGSFFHEFTDRLTIVDNTVFIIHVNNLQTREQVLQWYLDLNDGGVVHTDDELNRVRQLLEEEKRKSDGM